MTRARRHARHARSDDAYATAELLMATALLLLPVTLLVLTLPTWAERRSMAESVAYQATTALAESPDWPAGKQRAEAIVKEMVENYRLEPDDVELSWTPDRGAVRIERGEVVTAVVRVNAPALAIPGIGWQLGRVRQQAEHSETVDRYHSR